MGAPVGNNNATKSKPWKQALKRALARKHGDVTSGLISIASQIVEAADNGESWAIREIADRLDGKPAQQQIITGDEEGGPIRFEDVSDNELKRAITRLAAESGISLDADGTE